MKKFNPTLFKVTLFTAVFAGALTIVSCNQTADTKEIAEDNNDERFSDDKEDDADFLVAAAEINLEEIELGRLAQKNSSMPEVIELGKMMEAEHTQAQKDLQRLAAKKKIDIPTSITNKGQDAYDKLKDKSGSDFDKKYCDMMVKGHEDAIDKFEEAADDTKDGDIKSWAETMLVSLRTHLNHSRACEEKCAKVKS